LRFKKICGVSSSTADSAEHTEEHVIVSLESDDEHINHLHVPSLQDLILHVELSPSVPAPFVSLFLKERSFFQLRVLEHISQFEDQMSQESDTLGEEEHEQDAKDNGNNDAHDVEDT
jgi:hypothetical protein